MNCKYCSHTAHRDDVCQDASVMDACGCTDFLKHCAAGLDGECYEEGCPQIRDNEPVSTGRFCPLPPTGLVALREFGE